MSDEVRGLSKPVLAFALGLAGIIITGLIWATIGMGTSWATSVNAQITQNAKDTAALREEYRVINTKLDAMNELLKQHMSVDRR